MSAPARIPGPPGSCSNSPGLIETAPVIDRPGSVVAGRETTDRKQAEEALSQIQENLDRAQEVGKMGWWRLNVRHDVLTWSEEVHRIFGVAEGTPLTYENFLGMVHPDDRNHVDAHWQAALGGEPYDVEHRIVADGQVKWVREKAYLEWDTQGALLGGFGITQDITERKQAELALQESRQQLALALEAGQLGFWDWDVPSGRVQFGGHWAAMLGYELSEIEPHVQTWERLIHPDERTAVMATLADHLQGRTGFYECEHRMRHRDGSWLWILDRGRVVERDADGRPLRAIGTHADVTARREAENALREADRRKDEFLAMLGHELRNPLAPIRNGLHVLRKSGGQTQANERVYAMMERQVTHLVRLVDDLLEVSRITRGKIELRKERVDLAAVLGHAIESSQPLIEAGRHDLNVSLPQGPVYLDADPVRLAQVLSNLLNNAAKYMEPGGTIGVGAEWRGDEAVVRVRDAGIGISAELLPHVFDLFTQSDRSIDRAQGGLGIGLALVRRLVEMHGGRVEVHSEGLGRGSEFIIVLPLARDESAQAP